MRPSGRPALDAPPLPVISSLTLFPSGHDVPGGTETAMSLAQLALVLVAVILLAGVTVLAMIALPPQVRLWLIPILLIAAVALRLWRRG